MQSPRLPLSGRCSAFFVDEKKVIGKSAPCQVPRRSLVLEWPFPSSPNIISGINFGENWNNHLTDYNNSRGIKAVHKTQPSGAKTKSSHIPRK